MKWSNVQLWIYAAAFSAFVATFYLGDLGQAIHSFCVWGVLVAIK